VGTKLVTAYEQPSLDAIYKLTAIKEKNAWQYKMKISDAPNKMTWPGLHQVRRYFQKQKFVEDVIYDIELGITDKLPRKADRGEDLLIPIFRHGKLVYQQPDIQNMREKCIKQVSCFATDLKRKYSVRLAPSLSILRNKLKKILT
jgi:nicotinate phosphoribosyltransferase